MKLIIEYWPMLLILVLFLFVMKFFALIQKDENNCLCELKKHCNKIEENEINYVKNILVKNIGYYFILYIIASIIIGIFFFLFFKERIIKFLPIYCILIIISYLSAILPLINILKKTKSTYYKVNDIDVKTTINYIKSDPSDTSRSYIKYYFYFKNSNEQYHTGNAILIFNKLKDRFKLRESCLGECYIFDDKIIVKIKSDG